MTDVVAKLQTLVPEVTLLVGAVLAALLGLSRRKQVRDAVPWVTIATLLAAMVAVPFFNQLDGTTAAGLLMPMLGGTFKLGILAVAVLLCLLTVGLVDRRLEQAFATGRAPFDAMRTIRGEFYAFFLLSITGLSLVCSARDLVWLFLALELTSLPTYIMVALSRGSRRAQEAAVKYFFLGAMASAVFLYGFALLYGATGTLVLTDMRGTFALQASTGGVSNLAVIGMILTVLGLCFKIAAAPMHFYAADVYEGAAAPVTAFLAFVPKAAGMLALMLLLGTMGWSGHSMIVDSIGFRQPIEGLPQPVVTVLWMIATLTMTLGNVGALLQRSVKRMLAYSSIAHSGYMLIGIIAGPTTGLAAVLFYLFAYGIMNTAAFAVLAGLERRGEEIESLDDLAGLRQRHPGMSVVMALAAGSLMGLPPLLGFWGKLYLFIAGVQAGHVPLVVIAAVNSAIAAWYYLRLVGLPILSRPSPQSETIGNGLSVWPRVAGVLGAVGVIVLPLLLRPMFDTAALAVSGYAKADSPTAPAGTLAAKALASESLASEALASEQESAD
ncbi:MAG: NADH-quinone oxidoreductase subunit N [Phycisphaerales bacterium]|nr:NADH-quinone oxidoreductase subunit N [Phycisphaerales bacterium]